MPVLTTTQQNVLDGYVGDFKTMFTNIDDALDTSLGGASPTGTEKHRTVQELRRLKNKLLECISHGTTASLANDEKVNPNP